MAPDPNNVSGSGSGSGSTREETSVKVPSKDPKKKDEKKDEDLVSWISFAVMLLFNCREIRVKL